MLHKGSACSSFTLAFTSSVYAGQSYHKTIVKDGVTTTQIVNGAAKAVARETELKFVQRSSFISFGYH